MILARFSLVLAEQNVLSTKPDWLLMQRPKTCVGDMRARCWAGASSQRKRRRRPMERSAAASGWPSSWERARIST